MNNRVINLIAILISVIIIILVINYNKATAHNITGVYNSAITEQHPGKYYEIFQSMKKYLLLNTKV